MEKQFKPVPDVECLKYHGTPDKPDIKIFVSHRIDLDSETIDNPLYIPVRCGAVFDEREGVDMLGDDTGENISEKRMIYNELTVMYWAWKNIEADYYGLCHYRRYISFANKFYPEPQNKEYSIGCTFEDEINDKAIKRHNLTQQWMEEKIRIYDVICNHLVDLQGTPFKDVDDLINSDSNYYDPEIYGILWDIIAEKYPDFYMKYVPQYKKSTRRSSYNCFIMKKEVFNQYCEWLFSILNLLEAKIDSSKFSQTRTRFLGLCAEHLFGIYLLYLYDCKAYKIKEQQLTCFENTTRFPALQKSTNGTIPIVFTLNDKYVPYVGVVIKSIIDNSKTNDIYSITIFHKDISPVNQRRLHNFIRPHKNFSLHFFDASKFFGHERLYASAFVEEVYYKLIVPWVLDVCEKAIILDCDVIVKADLAELYHISVNGYAFAAVTDIVYQGFLNSNRKNELCCKEAQEFEDPYKYINVGVMLLNCEFIRQNYELKALIEYSKKAHFLWPEQDIFNIWFHDYIKYIEYRWNYYTCPTEELYQWIQNAPLSSYVSYQEDEKEIKVLHYASHPKPWKDLSTPYADEFWCVARTTPFYETILLRQISEQGQITSPPSVGVKGALIIYFKKHLPQKLWPIARKIKRFLRW